LDIAAVAKIPEPNYLTLAILRAGSKIKRFVISKIKPKCSIESTGVITDLLYLMDKPKD
jgi:hypothetical protein